MSLAPNTVGMHDGEIWDPEDHPPHPAVLIIIGIVVVAMIAVIAFGIKSSFDHNHKNEVSAYTPFEHEVLYDVVLLPIGGDDTHVEPNTVIIYEGTRGYDGLETMPLTFVDEDGVLSQTFQIPMDAIRVATYHPENSVEFSFTGNIINGSPDIMSAQAYIYRNLNDLHVNISPEESNRFQAAR